METDAARRLLEKIRQFVADELDDEERALFAALVAPGVACAYVDAEVTGFEAKEWVPTTLPDALVAALRRSHVRVEGFER